MKEKISKYVLCILILLVFIFTHQIKYEKTNSPSFLTQDNILDFIDNIDNVFFNSLCFKENTINFSNDEIIDYAVEYIILNYKDFDDEIINLNKTFTYEEEKSIYISIGFVNKSTINEISNKIFSITNLNFGNYRFLDKESDLVALVPMISDIPIRFSSRNIESITNTNNETLMVKVKYSFENKNFVYFEYLLKVKESKLSLERLNIHT